MSHTSRVTARPGEAACLATSACPGNTQNLVESAADAECRSILSALEWPCVRSPAAILLAQPCFWPGPRPPRAQLDNLLTGYSLTSWNEGDGHPLGTVYAMVQDPRGICGWAPTRGCSGSTARALSRGTHERRADCRPVPSSPVRTSAGACWSDWPKPAAVRAMQDGKAEGTHAPGPERQRRGDRAGGGRGRHAWGSRAASCYAVAAGVAQGELPWPFRQGLVLQPIVGSNGDRWWARGGASFEPPGRVRRVRAGVERNTCGASARMPGGTIWTTDIVTGYRRLGAPAAPRHPLEGAGIA